MAISKKPVEEFMNGKTLVLAKLVPCVVNTFLGWILAAIGGMHGLVLVLDKVRAGEEVGPTDVLNHAFDDLINRILFHLPGFAVVFGITIVSVIVGFIPGIGWMLQLALSFALVPAMLALSVIMPFALISVARDKTPWLEAWTAAAKQVTADFGGTGVYMLVTGVLSGIGGIACGIGALITLPMGLIAQIEGYDDAGGLQLTGSGGGGGDDAEVPTEAE